VEPDDELVADLRALGRSSDPATEDPAITDPAELVPAELGSAGLVSAVMARIGEAPAPAVPRRGSARSSRAGGPLRGRRAVVVAVLVALFALLGVPGVRAAVTGWFGFDGVVVHQRPGPAPTSAPPPPTAAAGLSLDSARSLVRFRPVVLTALGPPAGVEVAADRRLLSMSWPGGPGGTVRLDQFDGRLDYTFAKVSGDAEWTSVNGETALWFARSHEVVVLDAEGHPRTATARTAGPTLVWEFEGTVLRLEGRFDQAQAVALARSARPAG
jgi:hypothetical protein